MGLVPNPIVSRSSGKSGWSPTVSAATLPAPCPARLTRRYHALLVAALPVPFGRTVMLNYVWERLRWPDGRVGVAAEVVETSEGNELDSTQYLIGFRLEMGLPVWTYDVEGVRFEKRVLMPHLQNTTHISYRLLSHEAGTARAAAARRLPAPRSAGQPSGCGAVRAARVR